MSPTIQACPGKLQCSEKGQTVISDNLLRLDHAFSFSSSILRVLHNEVVLSCIVCK